MYIDHIIIDKPNTCIFKIMKYFLQPSNSFMIQSSTVIKEEHVTLHLSLNIFGFHTETKHNV